MPGYGRRDAEKDVRLNLGVTMGYELLKPEYLAHGDVVVPWSRYPELKARFPGADFERYGGVLRIAPGDSKGRGGQIAAHLQDRPGFNPADLGQVSPLATTFSGVAALTGVLNLGVSIAGFAIMNNKLNKLTEELRELQAVTQDGFSRVDARLDQLEAHLLDIKLVTCRTAVEVVDLRHDVADIGRLLDAERFARLAMLAERVCEGKSLDDPARFAVLTDGFAELRHFFSLALGGRPPEALNLKFVRDLGYFQAWSATLALEAQCYWASGNLDEGLARFGANLVPYADSARRYATALVGSVPGRFLAPGVEDVRSETFVRWMQHIEPVPGTKGEVLRHWTARRDSYLADNGISPARFLDELSPPAILAEGTAVERLLGSVERLDSHRLVLHACHRRGLSPRQWEAFASPAGDDSSLFLVALGRAA